MTDVGYNLTEYPVGLDFRRIIILTDIPYNPDHLYRHQGLPHKITTKPVFVDMWFNRFDYKWIHDVWSLDEEGKVLYVYRTTGDLYHTLVEVVDKKYKDKI